MSVYRKFIESAGGPTLSSTPIRQNPYERLASADCNCNFCLQNSVANKKSLFCAYSASCCCANKPAEFKRKSCADLQTRRLESVFQTDDPILLKWMQAMRFETELECLTALQARTLAIDEHSAGALSVRNSQVAIQELRRDSTYALKFIDDLLDALPLDFDSVNKFSTLFSELWTQLMGQTATKTTTTAAGGGGGGQYMQTISNRMQNNLTIINCTPRKSLAGARVSSLRPLDKLAVRIREECVEFAKQLYSYSGCVADSNYGHQRQHLQQINNDELYSSLRKIKELYGKFIETSIRIECVNIVRALKYDFSQDSLSRISSVASLRPVKQFESSSAQLPLKWALIALWQLTKDDNHICRTLTEKWQTVESSQCSDAPAKLISNGERPKVAKRLDYSTKYDDCNENAPFGSASSSETGGGHSLRADYETLFRICQNNQEFKRKQEAQQQTASDENRAAGALSSALKSKHQRPIRQVSTIELLIEIIISQPNKHERVDVMNFVHSQVQDSRLIDVDELDQSVSAAIYTSNQYKVAALRILNHLCVNDKAVKTILKCFSTPPPSCGKPIPENKIIRSIFECFQTSQEHIYQNETMFRGGQFNGPTTTHSSSRKRAKQIEPVFQVESEECSSDYGSRQTNSIPTTTTATTCSASLRSADGDGYEGDDDVVKEAIRLLVQLTTPFHRSNQGHDYYTLIGGFSIESLVKYLTNIIKSTQSREMLLLSLTTLANISFITTEPMKLNNTNRIVLEMLRTSKSRSKDLELRDQAVTLFANTADKNLSEIVNNGGMTFLLSCLETCPTRMTNFKLPAERLAGTSLYSCPDNDDADFDSHKSLIGRNKPRDRKPIELSEDFLDNLDCACDRQQTCLGKLTSSELAAMERIHQKAAVAFARMAIDPYVTRMTLEYGGVKQLIDLCKLRHKRNYSDTVLIACIAALRKMSKTIDRETFRHYNALDLIELDCNKALDIYGSRPSDKVIGQQHGCFASDV